MLARTDIQSFLLQLLEVLTIADTRDKEQLLKHLDLHSQGRTSYLEMSKGLAESGVKKWTVDTMNMTMTFYDTFGNEVFAETISLNRFF